MSESGSESFYYLNREEIKKLILCASSLRDRVIIKILARTGIRRGELRDLEIRDVDFDKRRIYIRSGKGDKSRTVPIDSDSLQDIKFYIGERETGKLIISNKQDCISLKQINEICAKSGKRSGLKHPNPAKTDINPHLFRHSFARMMLEKGMRMEEVQKILGHSTIKTTIDVYGTPGLESTQKNYDRIMEDL
jgi:integrase/recombinase XerD